MLKIGFLAFDKVQAMDLIAPYELLEVWQQSIITDFIKLYIIAEHQQPIKCSNSRFNLTPDYSYQNAPQLDYLFVPGGIGRCTEINNTTTINFIKQQYQHCKKILSICTGAFLLLEAGLLENINATTYWRALPELKAKHSQIREERIVKSPKIWTAGGVSSGIDLALELVKEIAGEEQATLARLAFEYFPNREQYSNFSLEHLKSYLGQPNRKNEIPIYIQKLLNV